MSGPAPVLRGIAAVVLVAAEHPDLTLVDAARVLIDAAGEPAAVVDGAEAVRLAAAARLGLRFAATRDGTTPADLGRVLSRLDEAAARRRERLAALAAADRLSRADSRTPSRGFDEPADDPAMWISTTEAERRFGLTASQWRRLARQRRIRVRRVGECWEVDAVEAFAWVNRRSRGNQ